MWEWKLAKSNLWLKWFVLPYFITASGCDYTPYDFAMGLSLGSNFKLL